MGIKSFSQLIAAIALCEFAGIIGLIFTVSAIPDWYTGLAKPALNPPSWVFGPVWTALYFLMGVSLYLVWKQEWKVTYPFFKKIRKAWNPWSERLWEGDLQKANVIAIFSVQYLLNITWSFTFFGMHLPGVAFFVILALWFSILYTMVNFYRISKPAAYVLVPYILWVSFAGYLNFVIWVLN